MKKDNLLKFLKFVGHSLIIIMVGMKIIALATKNHGYDQENKNMLKNNSNSKHNFYERFLKRFLDTTMSFIGMIVLSPIYVLISLAIVIDDPGPILFSQKRVGVNNTYFNLHKFRSMKMSTPHDTPTHLLENPEQYITRVGKILRKYSLDELPQIWDIFIGNMSIIGPRPALWNQYDLIAERDKYNANSVKPGLTGWAQINGRDELEIDVKAKFDGEYIEKLRGTSLEALKMDVKCFVGTIFSVATADGVLEGGTGNVDKCEAKDNINDNGLDSQNTEKKKVLFVATVVRLHINMFHQPFIKWFHDQGWQVDVAANNDYDNPADCVIPYCDNFYCLPFERSPIKKGNFSAYIQLKKLIDEGNYDIIHCHTPMGSVLTRLAAIKARKKGTKVIYTAHGFHFYKGSPLKNWLVYYPIEKILSHVTDLLITMNQEDYVNAQHMNAKQVALVNGVGLDLNKFKECSVEEKYQIRDELHLQNDDVFGISVAQLIPRKNHIVLIRAVAQLNNPKFHLFIVGDGKQEQELKDEAKKLNVDEQVHFLGFRTDVYRLCSAADLFLFASLQEGLPVAIMEAMACGKPIIASKIRGNVDLIDEGKGGYLINPNDVDGFVSAINYVVTNREQLQIMELYNLDKIRRYGIDTVIEQMGALYQEMSRGDI